MELNNAGGYTFTVDKWSLLERFLILGSNSPSYYVWDTLELTREHAANVIACLKEDGKRTIDAIVSISHSGRAPKNEPALFAMALSMSPSDVPDVATRQYAASNLGKVARTGTHLFSFVEFANSLRGWGAVLAKAVRYWYEDKQPDGLAYQVMKYQQRANWSHRDLIRLSHPKPSTNNSIYRYVVKGEYNEGVSPYIDGFELAKQAIDFKEVAKLIRQYKLTREMVPTKYLADPHVQEALLEHMPLTAMIRNLGNMSKSGLLVPLSDASRTVVSRLESEDYLRKARIHPLALLLAYGTYTAGHGLLGKGEWIPVGAVVDALMQGFYTSFANVEPTGQKVLIALDVSGSMIAFWQYTALTHAMIAAAQAMVFARTEKDHAILGFSDELVDLGITASDTLQTAMNKAYNRTFGQTDCSLPMLHAKSKRLDVDCFIVITDNETWFGNIQPCQALVGYRKAAMKPLAKLAVIATYGNKFSIADPKDPGMMDFAGFDANMPVLLADFIRGGSAVNEVVDTDD
jgi:60 kDa SS-A/Ro ribonucleoprotein